MPVLKGIEVTLTEDRLAQDLTEPDIHREAARALDRAHKLIDPKIAYRWVDVVAVDDESVTVVESATGGETRLELGPKTHLIAPAKCALISVCTIGASLDAEARMLNEQGEPVVSYLLDSFGVAALGEVSRAAWRLAEERAQSRNWSVGPCLAPGSLKGWPLRDHRSLCSLVPLSSIDVRLNEAGLLIPFKSTSSLVGIGPSFTDRQVGSACRHCRRAPSCWQGNDLES